MTGTRLCMASSFSFSGRKAGRLTKSGRGRPGFGVLLAATLLTVVLFPGTDLRAQGAGQIGASLLDGFRKADTNRDGNVTGAEMAAHRKQGFQAMDATADGRISLVEFMANPPSRLTDDVLGQWQASRAWQFRSLDSNRDGHLTLEEFSASSDKAFQMADANRDGSLSRQEIEGFLDRFAREIQKASIERRFRLIDQDGDGIINRAEFGASRRGGFAKADKDANGALSLREFNPDAPADPEGARREFSKLDTDGNGSISMNEFVAAGDGLFRKIDANGNGSLDLQELIAFTGG